MNILISKGKTERTGIVTAEGADHVVSGGHCESSALTNALRALGYGIVESDVAGGGGAPSFMFSNDGFPFLGGRSARMRETFLAAAKIPYRVVVPAPDEDLWEGVFKQIDSGIPVPLRVDMRFLPYLYGGKYGPKYMSFGWHWICLFAVDYSKGVAYVTDTEYSGLREIRLADLAKARTSKLKAWPPRAEWVAFERRPADWSLDRRALVAAALEAVADNYDGKDAWSAASADSTAAAPSASARAPATAAPAAGLPLPTGLAGIEAFPDALRSFDAYAKPWIVSPALALLGNCIEKNGTGGAAFRVLFRDFIARNADEGAVDALRALLPALDDAIPAWRALAGEFASAATAIGPRTKADKRGAVYELCARKAETVAATEKIVRARIETAREKRRRS